MIGEDVAASNSVIMLPQTKNPPKTEPSSARGPTVHVSGTLAHNKGEEGTLSAIIQFH
jgi:hypothetical protein